MRNLRWKLIYEGTMIALVIISLTSMLSDGDSNFKYIHRIIWFIFLIDVITRFIRTSVKWRYIKENPFDIVTVLPLEDMMLLARFARFLRLFRYKNLVKRYVDGISMKLEKFGFLRLSLSVLGINLLITFALIVFKDFGLVESTVWVWSNFLKFNYESTIDGFVVLSIIIKIAGLIYYGIVISEVMTIGRSMFERFKERKNDG